MRLTLLLGCLGIVAGAWIYARWWHADDGRPVSPQWLVDHNRRAWGAGIDAPCVSWPIDKVKNEHAGWQTQKLKRRA